MIFLKTLIFESYDCDSFIFLNVFYCVAIFTILDKLLQYIKIPQISYNL